MMLAVMLFFGLLSSWGIAPAATSGLQVKSFSGQPVRATDFRNTRVYYKSFLQRRALTGMMHQFLKVPLLLLMRLKCTLTHVKLTAVALLMLMIEAIKREFFKKAFLLFNVKDPVRNLV